MYGSTLSAQGLHVESVVTENVLRSHSQPVQRRVPHPSKRPRYRSIHELSGQLFEEAHHSYFHGRFSSNHGAIIMIPRRKCQPMLPLGSRTVGRNLSLKKSEALGTNQVLITAAEREKLREVSSPPSGISMDRNLLPSVIPLSVQGPPKSLSADDMWRRSVIMSHNNLVNGTPFAGVFSPRLEEGGLEVPRPTRAASAGASTLGEHQSALSQAALTVPTCSPLRSLSVAAEKSSIADSSEYSVTYREAFWKTAVLAIPATFTIGFTFCNSIVPLAFVGKLKGEEALTGASVGYFLISSLIIYPMIGLTFAMDTLCSHEFGRDPSSTELGLLLQRGILVNYILLTPLCLGIYGLEYFFVMLYGAKIAHKAVSFLLFSPLFIYLLTVLVALSKFLNNQLEARIPMIALSVGVFLCPFLQYFLTPLGVQYTMLGMALTVLIQISVMCGFIYRKPEIRARMGTWRFREALEWAEVKVYLKLALPSALFVAAEASSFDITILLAAHYGEALGSLWSSVMNLLFLFSAFAGGISVSACANIGASIGATDPVSVQRYINVAIILVMAISTVNFFALSLFLDNFLALFGIETSTMALASSFRYILPVLHFFDAVQFTFQGIFSGLGQNHIGAFILIACLWGVGIPLCFFLGSYMGWSLLGVCVGITVGLCIEAPIMILITTCFTDFDEICYLYLLNEEGAEGDEDYASVGTDEAFDETTYKEQVLRRSGVLIYPPRVHQETSSEKRNLWKKLLPGSERSTTSES